MSSSSVVASSTLMFTVFWDAFLLTTLVKSDYLSYSILPGPIRPFSSTRLVQQLISCFFLFSAPFYINSRDYENTWTSPPATKNHATITVNITWSCCSVSAWFFYVYFIPLHCCDTIGWFVLMTARISRRTGVPNKVPLESIFICLDSLMAPGRLRLTLSVIFRQYEGRMVKLCIPI